ncbi:4886_t:CDS:2 [Rhizophagus irregularis]|nr:4886_t:CDS:2 [Rhizophagus irregularis]
MSINEIPLINVPYPPELTVEEILSRRSEEKLGSKAPNRFFIYRVAYIKELRKRISNNISMTRISPYISLSWSKEPSEVKEAYKRLSELAENRLKEMRQRDTTPIFIHENFSPPSPPPNPMK